METTDTQPYDWDQLAATLATHTAWDAPSPAEPTASSPSPPPPPTQQHSRARSTTLCPQSLLHDLADPTISIADLTHIHHATVNTLAEATRSEDFKHALDAYRALSDLRATLQQANMTTVLAGIATTAESDETRRKAATTLSRSEPRKPSSGRRRATSTLPPASGNATRHHTTLPGPASSGTRKSSQSAAHTSPPHAEFYPRGMTTPGTTTPDDTARPCTVGNITIATGQPLTIIAGPCMFETLDLGLEVGHALRNACQQLSLPFIFKASFDKANRSSVASARGPGIDQGLDWLQTAAKELNCPVTTDIHEPGQADQIAAAVDMIQIPAFLCRQTDLLIAAGQAAAEHGRAVSVKKGQFLSPREMAGPVRKLAEVGCENVLLIERGTFFGYHRLVNDFTGLGDMMELDCSKFTTLGPPPVCFDVTHSTQLPGSGEQTGGRPDRAPLLANAATASGVHALFIEAHPDPSKAMSDGATQLPLDQIHGLLERVARISMAIG